VRLWQAKTSDGGVEGCRDAGECRWPEQQLAEVAGAHCVKCVCYIGRREAVYIVDPTQLVMLDMEAAIKSSIISCQDDMARACNIYISSSFAMLFPLQHATSPKSVPVFTLVFLH
jgi:hypothetical protein